MTELSFCWSCKPLARLPENVAPVIDAVASEAEPRRSTRNPSFPTELLKAPLVTVSVVMALVEAGLVVVCTLLALVPEVPGTRSFVNVIDPLVSSRSRPPERVPPLFWILIRAKLRLLALLVVMPSAVELWIDPPVQVGVATVQVPPLPVTVSPPVEPVLLRTIPLAAP